MLAGGKCTSAICAIQCILSRTEFNDNNVFKVYVRKTMHESFFLIEMLDFGFRMLYIFDFSLSENLILCTSNIILDN